MISQLDHSQDLLTSFQSLLDLLSREGVTHKSDLERQRIEIPAQSGALEGILVIFWGKDVPLIQCIYPFPFIVPEDRISVVESSIVRLNHYLDMAGFGFNHNKQLLYYRLTLPLRMPENTILKEEFQTLCRSTVNTATRFHTQFEKIIIQSLDPEEVLEPIFQQSSQERIT
jgi:hypothetical protein